MACRKCAKGAVRMRAGTATRCGRAIAGRIIGARNPPRKDMPWTPAKPPPLAEVSTGAAISPTARTARKPAAIRMVIARAPTNRPCFYKRLGSCPLASRQWITGGTLEPALDPENGKRPCAEYGGGGDERCKY